MAAPRRRSPPLLIALHHHHHRSPQEEERALSTISLHEVDANARLIGALSDDCNVALSSIRDEGASFAAERNPRVMRPRKYVCTWGTYTRRYDT